MQNFFAALLLLAPAIASPIAERTDACTSKSSKVTEWSLEGFDYHASYIYSTPAHQNSWGYIAFDVVNPALDYKVKCGTASSQLSDFFFGNMIYQCPAPEGENAITTFTYNHSSGEVTLNQTWTCHDDPIYPARFTAIGGGFSGDLTCTETFWQNPNWTIGQIYTSRDIVCDKFNLPVPIKEISAVA